MFYSLIPPILIILSLIGIILMLVKKSKQVSDLPDEPEREISEAVPEQLSFFGRMMWKIKSVRGDDAKHFFLAILEKTVRRFRVVFLKLESRFANLGNDIRSKRQARAQRASQNIEIRQENDIIRKLKNYQPENDDVLVRAEEDALEEAQIVEQREATVVDKGNSKKIIFAKKTELSEPAPANREAGRRNASHSDAGGEREVKPIISERIVTPRARTEIKDRLEELLIERIAINPKDIEAYERLGEYYMEIKSYMDAKECFKQVIKLNPSDRNAKYRMRRLENILAKQ